MLESETLFEFSYVVVMIHHIYLILNKQVDDFWWL